MVWETSPTSIVKYGRSSSMQRADDSTRRNSMRNSHRRGADLGRRTAWWNTRISARLLTTIRLSWRCLRQKCGEDSLCFGKIFDGCTEIDARSAVGAPWRSWKQLTSPSTPNQELMRRQMDC